MHRIAVAFGSRGEVSWLCDFAKGYVHVMTEESSRHLVELDTGD